MQYAKTKDRSVEFCASIWTERLEADVAAMRNNMAQASSVALAGFELQTH